MADYFSQWLQKHLANSEAKKEAHAIINDFRKNENFDALCKIAQGAPYHTEGPEVHDHFERALTVLLSLHNNEHYFEVEEWRGEKEKQGFFLRLQKTIANEKDFLGAYILAHDIGKKDTAYQDERGWHYPMHAQKGASEEYAGFREACLAHMQRPKAEAKLLRELIRIHMDIIWEIDHVPETRILAAAKEIAERQGVNVSRFMELIPATFFLDAVVGSCHEARSGYDSAALMTKYANREYATFPKQEEEDRLRIHRAEKEATQKAYIAAGLGTEEWFLRLKTPYGKERGRVVEILNRFIRGVENEDDVRYVGPEHTRELQHRATLLKK